MENMYTPFEGKRIVLGVTGSIACYKAADLASKLTQAGGLVDVILTPAAAQFVTPLTFQSVTGRSAYVDADLWSAQGHVVHIGLGRAAEIFAVAPASANTLAKLAQGIADNLLTVTALAASCPLVLAPAMDAGMYAHPATQANVATLKKRGAILVGPEQGHLASGMVGVGRMTEPGEILAQIRHILAGRGPLRGRRVVVSAAGTQEPIDPVRSITNRSSGKQGFAVTQAALDLGADVTLIAAPTHLPTPFGARRIDVRTAQQMLDCVMDEIPSADALIMAAAVADFRPSAIAGQKIKKGGEAPQIPLEMTTDILAKVAEYKSQYGFPRITVGFAAESQQVLENARAKLQAKHLDLIVANDVTAPDAGFGVDTNRVTLLYASGEAVSLPLLSKEQVAQHILEHVLNLLAKD